MLSGTSAAWVYFSNQRKKGGPPPGGLAGALNGREGGDLGTGRPKATELIMP